MNKKLFFLIVLAVVMTLGVSGQDSISSMGIYSEIILNNDSSLDLMAFGIGGGFMTHNPFLAACLNIPFGFWSWMNQDWLGGAIVSGLQAGGVAIMVTSGDDMMTLVGIGLISAGIGFGAMRAFILSSAYGGGFAQANNPLNRISLIALPDGNGGVVGSFTYSLSW